MPWERIAQITVVQGVNLLYQGTLELTYSATQFDSDVTLKSRYRGYILQSEDVASQFNFPVSRLAVRRVEVWSSFQYMDLPGALPSRYVQFISESKSNDVGKVLSMWAFQ